MHELVPVHYLVHRMGDTVIPTWTLGDRLRKAREEAGITPAMMADHLSRHRNTITNWENNYTRPTLRVVHRWAELTGTPIWWLLDQDPPKKGRSVTRRPTIEKPGSRESIGALVGRLAGIVAA